MTGHRKTFNGKTGNRDRAISPQHLSMFTDKRLIRRIYTRIVNF